MQKKAILSDINESLLETYIVIRDNWHELELLIAQHHTSHSKEHYYKERQKRYECSIARAAQFIYLNRTCWNGLFRVNLKGNFNVPIGSKKTLY